MKEQIRNITSLSLLLPAALFFIAVLLDLNILFGILATAPTMYTREAFVVVALMLSLPIIYRQKWASDRNVMRGLRSLFMLVLITFLALLLTNLDVFNLRSRVEEAGSIYESLSAYLFILAWTVLAVIFVLVIMGTLRNLVFIKQRRTTARNFHLLMFFLLLFSVFNFRNFENLNARFSFAIDDDVLGQFILFILIALMVINSFRISWLNYLNKKQKLGCFWGGSLLVIIQWVLFIKFHEINPAALFSPVLGKFVEMGMLLLAIYLSTAYIALIFFLPTAQLYDRKIRQISSLHNLSRAVSMEFDFKKLVQIVVRLAADVSEADCSWLELYDSRTQKLSLAASLLIDTQEAHHRDLDSRGSLTRQAMTKREPLLINHLAKSPYRLEMEQWKPDIQSLLVVPLTTPEKVLGFLFVCKRLEYGFEQDDLDTLRAFGEQVVIAIENVRLIQSSLEKERLEQELRIAHEAQMRLLPRVMPESKDFEIYARCITANEVGGDYYDFFPLEGDRVGVVVGDVSGKGASAAFYMAEVKGIMEALAQQAHSPKRVLALTNETLYNTIQRDNFVSVIYGILDPQQNCFTFCRAGHTPVLLARKHLDEITILEPNGIGLGLDSGALFNAMLEETNLFFDPGDALLLYTDGAIESRSESGEEFGEARLQEVFRDCRGLTAREIIEALVRTIRVHAGNAIPFDDLTLVAIKIKTT